MLINRSLLFVTLAAGLVGGCASGPGQPKRSAAEPVAVQIDFEPPAGWQVLAAENYDSAELGARLRLRLEEWPWVRMDLFAYRVGVTDDLNSGRQRILAQFRGEMDYAVEQGGYQGWDEQSEQELQIDGPALINTGTKLVMRVQKADREEGSLTYLYYRPPFALKLRASYPGHADANTEAAVDTAVKTLIPALQVTAPRACQGRSIELTLPTADSQRSAEEEVEILRVGLAQGLLRDALNGCTDLNEALAQVAEVCAQYQVLCSQPPWSMAEADED